MTMVEIFIVALGGVAIVLFLRSRDERVSLSPSSSSAGSGSSIEAHLSAGRTIEAIKLYREEHGVGLKEAKDAVDEMRRELASS
jgi:ribosomal protein L7/L12